MSIKLEAPKLPKGYYFEVGDLQNNLVTVILYQSRFPFYRLFPFVIAQGRCVNESSCIFGTMCNLKSSIPRNGRSEYEGAYPPRKHL